MLLESIAAGGTSEKCGQTAPYLDSLNELLCIWFNDLFWHPDILVEDDVFSEKQINVLQEFNNILRDSYPKGEERELSDINLLQDDAKWRAVVQAATKASRELHKL